MSCRLKTDCKNLRCAHRVGVMTSVVSRSVSVSHIAQLRMTADRI
uniref:Uncharacterized protein n=1 Tax=Anguilla anguilla TaxID=7936 RepID=A0A0E9TAI5_ANGAN